MTKIVRASLGLPTLREGPQFQNSKPVLVIEYWNLRFVCNLVLGICCFAMIHHSSRLPQGGKTIEAPSGGSPKPGPLGPDSLLSWRFRQPSFGLLAKSGVLTKLK